MNVRSPNVPRHRAIVAVDIENSTARTNSAKVRLREVMYELVEEALHVGGINRRYRDPLIDRGDGILALVHPVDRAPKTVLLNPVIPTLCRLLDEHNGRFTGQQLRLRAVIHAGEIHYDRRGCFGEALDVAFRLLDAPEVKSTLRGARTPLVLVVSDVIDRSVVRHGYRGIEDRSFEPLVTVTVADQEHRGWIQVPSERAKPDQHTLTAQALLHRLEATYSVK